MKKPVSALLLLLFLLIFTCTYQKTGVLYAKRNNFTPPALAALSTDPLPEIKKETTGPKNEEKKRETETRITKTKAEVLPKPIVKTKVLPAPVSVAVKEKKVTVAVHTEPKPVTTTIEEKSIPIVVTLKEEPKVEVKHAVSQNDTEQIDSLVEALKDREIAFKNREVAFKERESVFKNRDEFEAGLEQLLKKSLKNRSIAIVQMHKEELHRIQKQKELVKARDYAYNKIGQPKHTTSGE